MYNLEQLKVTLLVPQHNSNGQSQFLLERQIQAYLAENLHLLGVNGLVLVATEFQTTVGRIDILAKTKSSDLFAIELKRDVASREDVGQLQSYMGALSMANVGASVFGILVAAGLTDGARAALHVAQGVSFFKYKTTFLFDSVVRDHKDYPGFFVPAPPRTSNPNEIVGSERRYCMYCKDYRRANVLGNAVLECSSCKNVL
nr:endonuclease NucS domain-containing protein [uncultured Roseateles sp.]